MRRATAAALWLLLPGFDQPDAVREEPVLRAGRIRLRRLRRSRPRFHPHARQCPRCDPLAARAPGPGGSQQAPCRPRLHRPRRYAGHAPPALRQAGSTRHGHPHHRSHARRRLPLLGRTGQGARRLPSVQRRTLPVRRQLRLPPAQRGQGRNSQARPAQFAPAVDRPDRHHLAGLRRQCLERHRTAVLVDLQPQKAHAGRHAQGILGRGLRLAPLQAPGRRCEQATRLLRDRARDLGPGPQGHGRRRRTAYRHLDLEDGQRACRIPVRGLPGPLHDGMEVRPQGSCHLSPERGARLGAFGRHAEGRSPPRRRQGAAGFRLRHQPPPVDQGPAGAGAVQPALAEPPQHAGRQPVLDLHAGFTDRQVRALRRTHRAGRPPVAVRGMGQRPGRTARSGRRRQDAVDGHARQ